MKRAWLRECADWLAHLDADSYPPVVNLRPAADWPDTAGTVVGLARVRAVIDRIAADVDELARARRAGNDGPVSTAMASSFLNGPGTRGALVAVSAAGTGYRRGRAAG
jgi:hypothetical protein